MQTGSKAFITVDKNQILLSIVGAWLKIVTLFSIIGAPNRRDGS
jgi:hypothetical protein